MILPGSSIGKSSSTGNLLQSPRKKHHHLPKLRMEPPKRRVELRLGSLYPGTDFSILRHNCFPIGPLSRAAQSYITNTLRDFEKARVERIPGSHALDISE